LNKNFVITLSKFGIDPIFPAGDITILSVILAGKWLTTPLFGGFWGF